MRLESTTWSASVIWRPSRSSVRSTRSSWQGSPTGSMQNASEGVRLVGEGAPGYTFFVLIEGTAAVTSEGRTIALLGPGDFFGEVSILGDGTPYGDRYEYLARAASRVVRNRVSTARNGRSRDRDTHRGNDEHARRSNRWTRLITASGGSDAERQSAAAVSRRRGERRLRCRERKGRRPCDKDESAGRRA